MSGLLFPQYLLGKLFTLRKSPKFNSFVHKSPSGKTSRGAMTAYPLYEWELGYEFLQDFGQRINYVPWSQDFTGSGWTPGHAGAGLVGIVVGNYVGSTAPDGTYTADRVILNALPGSGGGDSSNIAIATSAAVPLAPAVGQTCTISVWMMTADGSSGIKVALAGLATNVVVTVGPTWQRYSITVTRNSSSSLSLWQLFLNAGGVTSAYADLLLWGATVEPGSVATLPYIPTFGSPVVAGSDLQTLIGFYNRMQGQVDTFLYQDPDFNSVTQQQFATGNGATTAFNLTVNYMAGNSIYLPDGLAGIAEYVQNALGAPQVYTQRYGNAELLSSAGRTNLALQSTMGASWPVTGGSSSINAGTAPDGTNHATQVTDSATTAAHAIQQSAITITASGRYTFSVWLKFTNHQFVNVHIDNGSTDGVVVPVDLVNGLLGTVQSSYSGATHPGYASNADATITPYPSGWWRVSISGQLPAADTSVRLSVSFEQNLTTPWFGNYLGTGTDTFLCWGAQFETGTVPTAQIPTTTTSVTVGADYSLTTLTTSGDVETFLQVSFAAAPANTVPLTWTGTFVYRCRFSEDSIDVSEFMNQFWEQKSLKFEQVIL